MLVILSLPLNSRVGVPVRVCLLTNCTKSTHPRGAAPVGRRSGRLDGEVPGSAFDSDTLEI